MSEIKVVPTDVCKCEHERSAHAPNKAFCLVYNCECSKFDPIEQAAPPLPRQICTCVGTCKGKEGLGERWFCALDKDAPEREPQRSEVKPNEYQSQKPAAIEQARPQTQPCQNPSPFPYHEDMCHICQFPIAAHRAAEPAPERTPPQVSPKFRNEPIHTHLNAQSWLKTQCENRWVPTFAYELVVQLLDDYYQFRTAKNG